MILSKPTSRLQKDIRFSDFRYLILEKLYLYGTRYCNLTGSAYGVCKVGSGYLYTCGVHTGTGCRREVGRWVRRGHSVMKYMPDKSHSLPLDRSLDPYPLVIYHFTRLS